MNDVLVIVPGVGLPELTIRCLEHLQQSTYQNLRLCYVDNGSDFEDFAKIRDHIHGMQMPWRIVINTKNEGFTKAINQGLAKREAAHVLVLNNDCRIAPDCIEKLVASLSDNIGSVCPLTNDFGSCSNRRIQNLGRQYGTRRMRVLPWFCCLLNSAALDRVPLLPDAAELASGLGVDDWWSLATAQHGFEHRLVYSTFAAHDHKATFRSTGQHRRKLQLTAIQWLRQYGRP